MYAIVQSCLLANLPGHNNVICLRPQPNLVLSSCSKLIIYLSYVQTPVDTRSVSLCPAVSTGLQATQMHQFC